jgi:hypothetical protein
MFEVLIETARDKDPAAAQYEERRQAARHTAKIAESEIKTNFSLTHSHALMGAWGALEGMIEDLCISRMQHDTSILNGPKFAKIKIPLVEFQTMSDSDRLRFVVTELQRDLGLELKSGATKFEPLLAVAGLGGFVDRRVRDSIFEAQNLRNVFAHRGGVADRKLVSNCPHLAYKVGDSVRVDSNVFSRNFYGLLAYGFVVLNRCRSLEGMQLSEIDFPGYEGVALTSDEADGKTGIIPRLT